LAKHNFLNSQN